MDRGGGGARTAPCGPARAAADARCRGARRLRLKGPRGRTWTGRAGTEKGGGRGPGAVPSSRLRGSGTPWRCRPGAERAVPAGGSRCPFKRRAPGAGGFIYMGARGCHVTGRAAGAAPGGTRGAMAGGDDGSWVELWCGPGCPEPMPSRFSCHADVEQMLLEAQLETESTEGALLALSSPAWDEDGAGLACEQPGESKLLPTHSQPQLGCPPPCQRDVSEETQWRERRLTASLGWARTCRPRHLSPKEFAFVCSPQPVLWSLQGGAVGRKKRLFSSELLLLFIPSLLLSHLLTLGLGIYIGKRLAASSANSL